MTEEFHLFGNYTGDDCPNCGRNRLVRTEDGRGAERIVCEKCYWEPALGDYSPDCYRS